MLPQPDLSCATWHKSTCSGQNGNCVEVARGLSRLVAVRDSKHRDDPALLVSPDAWRALLASV